MSLEAFIVLRLGDLALRAELSVVAGEVVVVLGPNGAGKSTLLRALAGLVPLDDGRVALDGQVLEDPATGRRIAPEARSVGFVFQEYRLFPHLSVLDNVAFGLRCRGRGRREARAGAREWLERVGCADRADALPGALSGGQAQRVALARALAVEPRLLLLDEPLAALDVRTRAELRRLLRDHLEAFPGIRLLVTHDPVEALALATRLVVLEHGAIVQAGPPAEVVGQPRSAYVADFAGVNLFRGQAAGDRVTLAGGAAFIVPDAGGGPVFAVIHPRAVALYRGHPEGSPRNVWRGPVVGLDDEGARVRVRVGGAVPIVAEVVRDAVAALELDRGGDVWVSVKAAEIRVYPA